jgi:hypothetical protein
VDLGGWVVADFDDVECPRLAEALTFPPGAAIDAGGTVVVFAGQGDDAGPFAACPAGVALCYHARFGISASRGDGIYLLRPGATGLADRARLPAGSVSPSRTWGRLPDGTGAFRTTAPTPGAPNAP